MALLAPLIWTAIAVIGVVVSFQAWRDAIDTLYYLRQRDGFLTLQDIATHHVQREFSRLVAQCINLILGLLSLFTLILGLFPPILGFTRPFLAFIFPVGLIAVAAIFTWQSIEDMRLRHRTMPTTPKQARQSDEMERRSKSRILERFHKAVERLRRKKQKEADTRLSQEEKTEP